jgi:hypothetical protein
LTHGLSLEEAKDWRAMLRRAVWQDDIDCRQTGILTREDTPARRALDGTERRDALAGIRCFKGLGPRSDKLSLDSENPEKAPQYPQNLPFVTVDVDGPFDDIGPTGYRLPIGTLDAAAQVHIQTEFTAASVGEWLHTMTGPSEPPPVLLAWVDAATPHPTHIGYDELAFLGFTTAPANYESYILNRDGLYAVLPDAPGGLSLAERRALHPPATNYAAPVLAIPCTVREFVEFLENADLWDVVGYPNKDYAPAWAALGLPKPAALLSEVEDAPAPTGEKSETRTLHRKEQHPLPDPANEAWRGDSAMELIERRMRAILWVIESKEFERMALDKGERGLIKELCEHIEPELFKRSTVFDDAWKEGSKRQWWRVADYHKYMKNRVP